MELNQSQAVDASDLTKEDIIDVRLSPFLSSVITAFVHHEKDEGMKNVLATIVKHKRLEVVIHTDGLGFGAGFVLDRGLKAPGATTTLINLMSIGLFARENKQRLAENEDVINETITTLIKAGTQEELMKFTHDLMTRFGLSPENMLITLVFHFK